MSFKFNSNLSQPYYGGSGGSTTLVPFVAEAALAGHPLRIDWLSEQPLHYVGIDGLRDQADQSSDAGEQSITRNAYFRRSGSSWHVGAGQRYYDRDGSDNRRFWESKGIEALTDKFQFTLLPTTILELLSSSTNLRMVIAGDHLYLTDGLDIKFWTDVTGGTFTSLTGEPASQATSIVTDGFNIFTSHGSNGIFKTTRGAAATASHITGIVDLLGYARGRFLAVSGTELFDATAIMYGAGGVAITTATSLLDHSNTDWVWTAFGEGSGHIYAAGFSGDKSLIYRITLTDAGTGLGPLTVAGELVDGEVVRSLKGYLGRFLFIGTDRGYRFAVVQETGDLTIGALVTTPLPVLDFEPQEEFVWYGLGQYGNVLTGGSATGLGKFSTSQFSDLPNLVPSYQSDLMVDGQSNNILSIVTFQGIRMFTVNQIGLYFQGTDKVEEGYLDTGLINFNMTEKKTGLFIDAQHTGDQGEHEVRVSIDGGSFVSLGTHNEGMALNLGQVDADNFEIRHVLTRDSTDLTQALMMNSWLMRVQPRPELTDFIYVTVFIAEQVESIQDAYLYYNTFSELEFIANLYRTKQLTTFQWGERSDTVVVDRYRMMVTEVMEGQTGVKGFNASCLLELKRVF